MRNLNLLLFYYVKNKTQKESDNTKMNFKEEIFKSIQGMVDRAVANCKVDRTYKTGIKRVTSKGYVVLDDAGSERTVQCAIPGVELKPMQMVWVTMPQGKLNDMFISGVVGK